MMKHFGSRGIKTLWVAHIIVVGVWMGIGVSMLALILMARNASKEALHGIIVSILRLDNVAAGTASSVLLTALAFGIWTPWGFFKQKWIVLKWVLLIVQTQFIGYLVMMPRLHENLLVLKNGGFPTGDHRFSGNLQVLTAAIVIQVACLFFTVIISRLKPWTRIAAGHAVGRSLNG